MSDDSPCCKSHDTFSAFLPLTCTPCIIYAPLHTFFACILSRSISNHYLRSCGNVTCSRPQRKACRLRIEPRTSGTGVNHSNLCQSAHARIQRGGTGGLDPPPWNLTILPKKKVISGFFGGWTLPRLRPKITIFVGPPLMKISGSAHAAPLSILLCCHV